MTEPSQHSIPQTNWRWMLLALVSIWAFFGFSLLVFFTDDWVPFWIQISIAILFATLAIGLCVHFIYEVSKNLSEYKLTWRSVRLGFKPFILFACVALMVLSWIVALFKYNLVWCLIALGTTLLAFSIGFYSLRNAVQQIQSTETDIV
ncbi:MAG: hypothetical protein OXH31_06855 [Gammaproteobacteria bacterium]|nr:hypothetical protein [Gammaproteobacteria bacterium]